MSTPDAGPIGDAGPVDGDRPRSRLVLLTLWVVAIVTWLVISRQRGLGPIEAADSLRGLLADNWWGPVLYVAVYTLRPVILFPASVLTVLGGLAFGPVAGVVYTVIGSNLSTAANYVAARFLTGRRPLRPPFGQRALDRLVANPFETTLILRLVAAPFDAVPLAAGALGLRFWPFLAGSFLGTITGTIAFVAFGASIESLSDGSPELDPTLVAISIGLTVAGLVVARLLRRRRPDLATAEPADEPAGEPTTREVAT
ncbi:MAG: VTT domain-containing protein [Actinomycetota bacterium]